MEVPPTLVQTTYDFENSMIRKQWQQSKRASPGSMFEISVRMVNLRAIFKRSEAIDIHYFREKALELERDLQSWKAGVPLSWTYTTQNDTQASTDTPFGGKSHFYPTLGLTDAWNHWRTLRIFVNKIIVQNEDRSIAPDNAQRSLAISIIREMSSDLCISTSSYIDTPCKLHMPRCQIVCLALKVTIVLMSLIRPLYLVALEEINFSSLRFFAIEKLRYIDASMGIRQAGLFAQTAFKHLSNSEKLPANNFLDAFSVIDSSDSL
jgi:hypothetical protein